MFSHILRSMSFRVLAKVLCLLFYLQFSSSNPLKDTESLYSLFVKDMTDKNCMLPTEIELPFSFKGNSIEAFASSLYICQKVEYVEFAPEAPLLCREIFAFLKNIYCLPKNIALPHIEVNLSSDVCKDFALNEAVLPEGLMKHLSDNFTCNLMCNGDFKAPCQVLLWSFFVQLQVKGTLENSQKSAEIPKSPLTESQQGTLENSQKSAEISKLPLTESQQEQDKKTVVQSTRAEQPKDRENTQKEKIDTFVVQTSDKNVEPALAQTKSVQSEDNMQAEAVHQEANQQTDHTQITKTKDVAKESNVADVEISPEPVSINVKNKIEKVSTSITNPQIKNIHGNVDVSDGVPEPVSDISAQQDQVTDNSVNPSADSKVTEVKDPDKGDSANGNELEQNQHSNTSDASAQNTHDAQIQILPGFNASHVINIAQDDQHTSTKKDDIPSITVTEIKKIPTEPSLIRKNPVSNIMSADNTSPTPVISSAPTAALEKMEDDIPLPGDKDLDQYNDLDNNDGDIDGEYNKQDYDGTVYEPTKNKESNSGTPSAINIPKEPIVDQKEDSKGYSGYPSRDTFGRGSDEIQVIASFKEQEDSHFFFYFLSIVLILMAGYLIFHNKQKIIALIVEGRHERRRRSHGLGYKKLETK